MRSRLIRAVAIGTMAGLGLAGPASAQDRPYVSAAPATSGSAIVGSTLTSTGGQAGGPRGTTVGRAWLRCDNATDERSCDLINGAWNTSTYTLKADDLGKYMRSALYAYRDRYMRDLAWRMSPATAAVTNPPRPRRRRPRRPRSRRRPRPGARPAVADRTGAATGRARHRRPRPSACARSRTVRISGVVFARGAQISRLTVRAPRGARITISCFGKGCPNRRVKRVARGKSIHVPAYEKYLRSGVRLVITISRKGYVSKVTTIKIRKQKAPLRSDLCRVPGATTTSKC